MRQTAVGNSQPGRAIARGHMKMEAVEGTSLQGETPSSFFMSSRGAARRRETVLKCS
jgi:hypothetical protein